MSKMNPEVDIYFNAGCGRCPLMNTPQCKVNHWREELEQLRMIILECELTEELKWGVPCYTFQNGNVVLLSAFNEYCALNFFKGALLNDVNCILIQQTKNTQATRQIRFSDVREIEALEKTLKSYIHQAVEIEKAGSNVIYKQTAEFELPKEFENKLEANNALKTAFAALTPGRQRAYILYFSAPKQSRTRESRVEKCLPRILIGKGLND